MPRLTTHASLEPAHGLLGGKALPSRRQAARASDGGGVHGGNDKGSQGPKVQGFKGPRSKVQRSGGRTKLTVTKSFRDNLRSHRIQWSGMPSRLDRLKRDWRFSRPVGPRAVHGPPSQRGVVEGWIRGGPHPGIGYTTTLKLMQIMAEKGLVPRATNRPTHVYAARSSQDRTQRQLVSDLVDRGVRRLGGRAPPPGAQRHSAFSEEIEEIRQLITNYQATGSQEPRETAANRREDEEWQDD